MSVDRGAAGFQDIERNLRRERLARRRHAVGREDLRARGEIAAVDAVDLGQGGDADRGGKQAGRETTDETTVFHSEGEPVKASGWDENSETNEQTQSVKKRIAAVARKTKPSVTT